MHTPVAVLQSTACNTLSQEYDHSARSGRPGGKAGDPTGTSGCRDAGRDDPQVVELGSMFAYIWAQGRALGIILGGFLVFGVLLSFTSPVEFESKVTLLPHSDEGVINARPAVMDEVTSFLGIRMQPMRESFTDIPSLLYLEIARSVPFQLELMNTPLRFSSLDTTLTAHQYFSEWYPESNMSGLRQLVIRTRRAIASLFRGPAGAAEYYGNPVQGALIEQARRDTVIALTSEQKRTMRELRGRIYITDEPQTITIRAELPDPMAAADLGRAATETLMEYIREYKRYHALQELDFSRRQLEESRTRYLQLQDEMVRFLDRNYMLTSAGPLLHLEELETRVGQAFGTYSRIFQQVQQKEMKVQKRTPVFNTINPLEVPDSPSKPNLQMILMVSLFLGMLACILYLLVKNQWDELRLYAARAH